MFKLIDRTLTAIKLEEDYPTGEMLARMCELLPRLGVDYIEISVPVLRLIGELPIGPKYILKVDTLEEMEKYNTFEMYVSKCKEDLKSDKVIHEIQVNDAREIPMLNRYEHLKNVRITGLDDLMCTDYMVSLKRLREIFTHPISLCPQNTYYCATALALEWLLSGGKSIAVSFAGIGGYAVLEEILMAIKVIMHKKINVDLSILPEVTHLYETITKRKVNYNKPILGDNIFSVEAGIHADGISKNPLTYEPYDPQSVGKVRKIVVGKHSGASAIRIKLKEKGAKLPDHLIEVVLEQVKKESILKKRSLTDQEFIRIVKEVVASEKQKIYS
ncbi:homocitrate synthase/isopropylmalate synthase family protein [Cellulosilyticum sp. I15G10I2]|uniref:homocitrate synthase/isopropylmalate synthase family protein n=1 Tax=Cellulosilyticum sp. I15G10I2 TaxID=1892843 RepID=UPI00085BAF9A|nr:hypothetical protein [Cellulosilyticum sp. I15G10I2]